MNQKEEENSAINKLYLMSAPIQKSSDKLSIHSFQMISLLGKGTYANVILAKKNDNQQIYAIKMIKKKSVAKNKKMIKSERDIFTMVDHPFIVKLAYAFQNENYLYFCLEYCPGGEVFNLICKYGRLKENQTKFYAAQTILAIEYLHSKDIIYRDLKPENVLIDKQGYIKITDFGLSKTGVNQDKKTFSLCGTVEYLAPEVVNNTIGYQKPADWWTLGCFIYELVTRDPPFFGNSKEEVKQKILNEEPIMLSYFSKPLKDLLIKLFKKNPEERLGFKGSQEIKNHPWFSGLDWSQILSKQIQPPFIPKITNDNDVSNFDEIFTKEQLNFSPSSGSFKHTISDFTYEENAFQFQSQDDKIN